ncbi:MAG: peptidyl-prolyl cis-trans isomerase [Proteobacteria bacterium]|nr:peptidyl-prolyl cis-trans isomerase [Pseudomonadota bacterium]MBU1418303.1 peptidyl-prolyl cis-trans isomerase [Pseudomonadota bacterium]MBU1455397.1 peptidyl-prolyl cis-trans isomerase [Pseudomonadota bacterium]
MYRISKILFFCFILSLCAALPLHGSWLPWSSQTLVSIGDEDYSNEDFKIWWENWQEKDMQLPESPAPFVDWILLFKEAERMKLYESPVYRKKALTFLKARTLMFLKNEEIDSKIKISEDDLWKQYLKSHAPQYQINIFFFKKQEAAQAFVDKLGQEVISDEEFATRHGRDDGYFSQRSEWYRPLAINPGWLPILHELEKGKMSQPVPWKGDFVVLRLQNVLEGNKNDFESIRNQLREKVWKEQENRLTVDLLTRLRQQYHVKIDSERLEQLDTEAPNDAGSDEPLIFTDKGNISEQIVLAKIHQLQRFRRQNGFQVENSFQFKNQVVNGIIDQTLTSWEALAREYEKKPPFEAIYQFYCRHRMTKMLEERLFAPQAKVTEEEIKAYYQENLHLFTQPEIIRMAIIEGTEKSLNDLWLEVALGGDFMTLARQRTGGDVPIRDIPVNHLHPQVKEVVDKLTKNEVSKAFTVDEHVSLVQLVERKPKQTMPLAEVKEDIKQSLYVAKMATLRQDYLDKLRVEYAVETNDTAWQNLKKEMEQDD